MTPCAYILLAILAQPGLLAQAPAPRVAPRLQITPPGRIALGSVGPREVKTLAYTFHNRSAAAIWLRLADLSPGLKAWGPALEVPLEPDQSLGLNLSVDPTDFVGHQVRSIRLLTDDPAQGEYRLPLTLEVRPDLAVDSTSLDFGSVAPFESPQAVFTFRRETQQPTVLRLSKPLPPYLESELVVKGAETRLEVTLRPALVPAGAAMGMETLELASNAPQQPQFTLYLRWRLHQAVEPSPSRLVFLEPATGKLELRLKAGDGKPFLLESAQVEGAGFAVAALPSRPASTQVLTVQRTAQAEAQAMLVLRFKGQEQPLKVPLAYRPPSN